MYRIIFMYLSWYLCVGFVVAFVIDQSIRYTKQVQPYTSREIAVSIILWPLMAIIFIYGVINGFFNNESN
jgi:hypothetical protein